VRSILIVCSLLVVAQTTYFKSTTLYWIYLLLSTQQTIGCNGFYNDKFRLTRVIVRLCSEPFGFVLLLLTVLEVVGRYEVVAVLSR
jgi:hypothetical protein